MTVRAKPAQARSLRRDVTPPGRRQRRAVLPSGRVCAFLIPTVEEHMRLTEQAVANVQRRAPAGIDPVPMEYSNELAALGVRQLLAGMTAEPVPEMYRDGVTLERVRAESEATLRADLANRNVKGEAADAAVAERLPAIVDDVLGAARDPEKMCAVANLVPLHGNDLEWIEGESVGAYLRAAPHAEIGSPEAEDWAALHRVALIAIQPRGTDPKAGTRTRPLMISGIG